MPLWPCFVSQQQGISDCTLGDGWRYYDLQLQNKISRSMAHQGETHVVFETTKLLLRQGDVQITGHFNLAMNTFGLTFVTKQLVHVNIANV